MAFVRQIKPVESSTVDRVYVGCSGWSYGDWAGRFYPRGLPTSGWFEYYSKHFNTVELNNTFYHIPRQTTIDRWARQAPEGFIYAVKAHRSITHIKRLKAVEQQVKAFSNLVAGLRPHLGPVLYQLPPGLKKDIALLSSFLATLPDGLQAAVEFRHRSWYEDSVFDALKRHGVALCLHDMSESSTPLLVTAGFVYIRFHGPSGRYRGSYSDQTLSEWARWVRSQTGIHSVHAYFNNDVGGHAVSNALTFRSFPLTR